MIVVRVLEKVLRYFMYKLEKKVLYKFVFVNGKLLLEVESGKVGNYVYKE